MAVYEVSVTASFPARHGVALPDGAEEPPHEHQWQVVAVLRAEALDGSGFVVDFVAAQQALTSLAAGLAKANLNEVLGRAASAERLAEHLAGELAQRLGKGVYCLRVQEAPGCWAAFYPDPADGSA